MAIEKKSTKGYDKQFARRIMRTYMQDGKGMVVFINHNTSECHLPVTPEEYAHITSGAGTTIDAFEDGLFKTSRYYYRIDTAKDENNIDTVVAVHSVPEAMYMDCDWEDELKRSIPAGGVICTIRDNGGVDVNCFPAEFKGYENAFLSRVADLDKITNTTQFELDSKVTAKARSLNGSEATFVLRRA